MPQNRARRHDPLRAAQSKKNPRHESGPQAAHFLAIAPGAAGGERRGRRLMRALATTTQEDPGCAATRTGVTKSLRVYNNGIPIELIEVCRDADRRKARGEHARACRCPGLRSLGRIVRPNRWRCANCLTPRNIIVLMQTIKELYISLNGALGRGCKAG